MSRVSPLLMVVLSSSCAIYAPRANVQASLVPVVANTTELTIDDVINLRRVVDVAVAPRGNRIAYVLSDPRQADERPGPRRTIIYLVDSDGGPAKRLTPADVTSRSPQWSPNGRWLGFLSRWGGTNAIFRTPVDGGESEILTPDKLDVRAFAWSPDGRRIAFLAARETTGAQVRAKTEGRDWTIGDGEPRFQRLWVLDVATGRTRVLTPFETHIEALCWSPSSDRLLVRASERADIDSVMMRGELRVVELRGATMRAVAKTAGKLGFFDWSPDATEIAYLGASELADPTPGVLFTVDVRDGIPRAVTGDRLSTGQWLRWLGDGSILLLSNAGTATRVERVDPRTGRSREVIGAGPICSTADVSRDGQTFACVGSTPLHPHEVFVGSATARTKLRRITDSNPWLAGRRLGHQEVVTWTATDGLELAGILVKPVGYQAGRAYPLAVLVHGGPEGVSLDGWNTSYAYPAQLFASRGYMVFEPNYRGSQGRGVEFGKANQEDLGGREFGDVLDGIDALVAAGLVDGDRVGMGGWSYGGYFAALAATAHSERFKVAMVGAAITDWVAFMGTTEMESENALVHWAVRPWDNLQLLWSRSPVAHIENSTTATLIVHGALDTRVPYQQSIELYRGLRHFDVPTELVTYPREGHGLAERAHQRDFAARVLSWFDRALKHPRPRRPSATRAGERAEAALDGGAPPPHATNVGE